MTDSFIFRPITRQEIPRLFAMIRERMAWMDEQGIRQWNVMQYDQIYPQTYYEQERQKGHVFVLEEDGMLVCGAVLKERDDRWQDDQPALYVHNFVSQTGTKGAGAVFLRYAEAYALEKGRQYLRLDSAQDNQALSRYYESLGFRAAGSCQAGLYRGVLRQKDLRPAAILDYLKRQYQPLAVMTYGSFADGSQNTHSDFDALVIANGPKKHDTSTVAGTVLDVFVYPPETFATSYDPMDFVQVFDSAIVIDRDGMGAKLKNSVLETMERQPFPTREEVQEEIDWCRKMQRRSLRADAEGFYRWHWVLMDSLEIYCDACGRRYLGPKKSLAWMRKNDPAGYDLYARALKDFSQPALERWLDYLQQKL